MNENRHFQLVVQCEDFRVHSEHVWKKLAHALGILCKLANESTGQGTAHVQGGGDVATLGRGVPLRWCKRALTIQNGSHRYKGTSATTTATATRPSENNRI